jgi:bifunctional enzyme CysN/CysC
MLQVPHLVLCVNKMDLVDFSQDVYEGIRQEFEQFATRLQVNDLRVIPISALHGDNMVTRSDKTPWYDGPTLLHHLENLYVASDRNLIDVRFPVQFVIRPKSTEHHDYRGYAGQVAGGVLKAGDEVMVLPSGLTSRIASVETADGPLEDDIDVSRGDMICRPNNAPAVAQDVEAMVCWMAEEPLRAGQKFAIKHTTRMARAVVKDVRYRLDVNTLHRDEGAAQLGLNDIGRLQLRTTQPLLCDPYSRNRTTGAFILIDERTNRTVAAGMIAAAT